ncbi:MAG TPA: polysaccharide biosynthesis protein [Thermoanaerobaculia bacterium]
MRTIQFRELLPARTIAPDIEAMRRFIRGRRVLVTGAGGSIGSELCRQLARLDCGALIMYERHENSLHEILLRIDERLATPILGDILDSKRLDDTFSVCRPDIVFHAAAHKHVTLMEGHAGEAVKNNVSGTRAVAEAADRHGAERFVLVSTDKAVNPSCVMGATKRVAELLMRAAAARSRTKFITVRLGNVLGSSGSVAPRFLAQLRDGRPLTVTHPEVRRFFILVPEAVQLVIESAAAGQSGGTYVLEMGEPVRIVDLAHRMIALSGTTSSVEFIGLRPGEKLEEELVGPSEVAEATWTPHIFIIRSNVPVPGTFEADLALLERLAACGAPAETIDQLRAIVPEFVPAVSPAAARV